MSTDVLVREDENLCAMSLDELRQTVEVEHAKVLDSLNDALVHAIAAGQALMAVKELVDPGDWLSWLEQEAPCAVSTSQVYIRIAHYRDEVLAPDGPKTLIDARNFLTGKPSVENMGRWKEKPPELKQEVKRLNGEGMGHREIAELVGVSKTTVTRWLDPTWNERHGKYLKRKREERQRQRDALRRQERDKAVKRHGGSPSHAYADLRKSAAHLQRAIDEAEDHEAGTCLRSAYDLLTKAEDEIAKALRVP